MKKANLVIHGNLISRGNISSDKELELYINVSDLTEHFDISEAIQIWGDVHVDSMIITGAVVCTGSIIANE